MNAISFPGNMPVVALVLTLCLAIPGCTDTPDTAQTAQGAHEGHESPVSDGQELGAVHFDVDCDPAVRDDFDRSLALMHHMMYQQARAAFREIAENHPECAMAHWGVATTMFQPLWPERPDEETLRQGLEIIEQGRDAAPETERERLLVDATAAFFRDPENASYRQRVEAWADAMETAHETTPEDLDVAALYGLSLLAVAFGAEREERDALHDDAERILRDVWEREQTHPGAIHYSIHATDVDGRAENALDMVEVYGKVAPEVPHALHMPSHIYVRLGDWEEVIEWNIRSADAAVDHEVNGSISFHYVHAIDYLVYGYLQQGDDAKAEAVYQEALEVGRHQPSFASAFHLAAMPARLAVEQRDWEAASALAPRQPEHQPWETSHWAEGLTWYARGLGGVHGGDMELAREAEQQLKHLRYRARDAGEDGHADNIEVDRRILSGWIAHRDGRGEEAMDLMRAAAELEGAMEKDPITPGALAPPGEALGDLLMEMERPADALKAYRDSDAIWPGRFNTLLGAVRAAEAADEEQLAEEFRQRLLAIAGDSDREQLQPLRADAR